MTRHYLTVQELKKYIGRNAFYTFPVPPSLGKLLGVHSNGDIEIELDEGLSVHHYTNLGYMNPYIDGKVIRSEGWKEFIIILEWEKCCLYCDSKCKKGDNEVCSLFRSKLEMRK